MNLRNDIKQIGGIVLVSGLYLLAVTTEGCRAISYEPKTEEEKRQVEQIRKEHYQRMNSRTTLEDFSR